MFGLNTKNKKILFKSLGALLIIPFLVLWWTNPTLNEFKEVCPTSLMVESRYGYCKKDWQLSAVKIKNCFFYSYYEFSYGCSKWIKADDYYSEGRWKMSDSHKHRYIGIFGNFYPVEYYYDETGKLQINNPF